VIGLRLRSTGVALVALAVGAVGCSSSSSGPKIAVTSTDKACVPAQTRLDAGKLTFEITNKGKQTTELYVFGAGDKVISEVENVGPGTSRTLTVDLAAGAYQLGCKPGQKGNGIRADITVVGKGGAVKAGTKAADRDVELTAVDYSFDLKDPGIKAGETILFEMKNAGDQPHDFEVFTPDNKVLGEIDQTEPGKTGKATLTFDKPGRYRYICDVSDHQSRGMKGTFTVAPQQ
jgi:uncharacterized cupredoxin-like copper-binding protein